MTTTNYGNGSFWAPPAIIDGKLHRGVFRCANQTVLKDVNRDNWVVMHCDHWDVPPPVEAPVDMWLFNPVYEKEYGHLPHAAITGRDLVDPDVFRPLHCEKEFDVVSVMGWTATKRHVLLMDAVRYAKDTGRPFSVLLSGYHWAAAQTATNPKYEQQTLQTIEEHQLPVTVMQADWSPAEVNRRHNTGRVHVGTSHTEGGGPRSQVEANLAGLPHVHTEDAKGGFTADISEANGNGVLCPPTAKGIAEAIWYCLDNLQKFNPRKWALANACKPVGTAKLAAALRELAADKGWHINVGGLDCHSYIFPDWYRKVIDADIAG